MQPWVIASDYYAMLNTQVASSNSTSAEKAPFHQSLTTWCCFHLGSSLNSAVLKISKSSIFQAWLAFPQAWFPSPTLGNGLTGKDAQALLAKVSIFELKKWHLGFKTSETTFRSPTIPKSDGIAFRFKCFPVLSGFSANFEIWYLFCNFLAVCYLSLMGL